MDIQNLLFMILVGSFVGAAAGYLGSFMVLKRMALVGDALSHVALPGMAIALTFHFSPILGAFVALTLALLGVWYLEKTSLIYPDALVGIFFTTSLAIGILITPEPELLEALFGNIERIKIGEGILAMALSLSVIVVTFSIAKKIMLGLISEELAKSAGIAIKKINLIYLLLVGVVVALGVRFIGTLLMGALVIIPAVSAKNISVSIKSYYSLSIYFGILSAIIGIIIAQAYKISTGPSVVLVSVFIFVISYIIKKIPLKKLM
jgi:ABC-type Mn2+/Zn2+ transport system permease subunit